MKKALHYIFLVFISLSFTSTCFAVPGSEDEKQLSTLLQSYFKVLQKMYPPNEDQTDVKPMALDSRRNTKQFWALKDRDIKMPDMLSAQAFMFYKPSGWEITKYSVAGDYAKTKVTLTIGDPVRKRMRERVANDLKRRVSYSFVKMNDKWLIVNFKDLDGEKARKVSDAQREKEKKRIDISLVQGKSAVEVVELYLTTVKKLVGNKNVMTHMKQAVLETTSIWVKKRSANRERSQNVSQLILKAPFSWTVIEEKKTKNGTAVHVGIKSESNKPGMAFLKNMKIAYSLVRKDSIWLIEGAQMLR